MMLICSLSAVACGKITQKPETEIQKFFKKYETAINNSDEEGVLSCINPTKVIEAYAKMNDKTLAEMRESALETLAKSEISYYKSSEPADFVIEKMEHLDSKYISEINEYLDLGEYITEGYGIYLDGEEWCSIKYLDYDVYVFYGADGWFDGTTIVNGKWKSEHKLQ